MRGVMVAAVLLSIAPTGSADSETCEDVGAMAESFVCAGGAAHGASDCSEEGSYSSGYNYLWAYYEGANLWLTGYSRCRHGGYAENGVQAEVSRGPYLYGIPVGDPGFRWIAWDDGSGTRCHMSGTSERGLGCPLGPPPNLGWGRTGVLLP